jgi:hypothetical protein
LLIVHAYIEITDPFGAPDMAEAVAPSGNSQDIGRILIVIEGESLVNDATALMVLGFALPARRPGGLVPGLSLGETAFSNAPAFGSPDGERLARGSPKARENRTESLKITLFDRSTVGGLLQPMTAARVSGSGEPGDLDLMYWTISKIPWLYIITTGQGAYARP